MGDSRRELKFPLETENIKYLNFLYLLTCTDCTVPGITNISFYFSLIRCGLRKMDIAVIGQNCPQLKSLDLSESSLFDVFGPPEVMNLQIILRHNPIMLQRGFSSWTFHLFVILGISCYFQ